MLDHPPNFLHRVLREMGFTNLVAIGDGAAAQLGPFRTTLYAPFTTHLFHESTIGNLIDSAAVFEQGGRSVFNFNDNTPDVASALRLKARHGRPTVAQIADREPARPCLNRGGIFGIMRGRTHLKTGGGARFETHPSPGGRLGGNH